MLLPSGPPGSGKTSHTLAEFRQALQQGATDIRLLTPTATMAEHYRHILAREGFLLRPRWIQTLSHFVAPWVEDLPQIPPASFQLLVERVARRLAPPEFERVLRTPGFCAALAQAVDEFSSAGCDAARLERSLPRTLFGQPFVAIYKEMERELARRGFGLRAGRLDRAAQRIARDGLPGVSVVWMDGFFTFTDPELAVIRAIGGHAKVNVATPDVEALAGKAWPATQAFSAATVDREAEEISRRILSEAAAGRAFREIGIAVRNPDVYLPALRAALERFGIPARFYFSGKLIDHATVRLVAGVVTALLSGWDHAVTLAALRFWGDSPELDRFDFAVREQLPGSGLESLQALTKDSGLLNLLNDLSKLEQWRTLTLTPSQWAAKVGQAIRLPNSAGPSHALPALTEAASFLEESRRIPLDEFWTAAEAILRLTPLRIPDRRRNVVHVLSVYEARQWELPVVFICGLAEQQFPKRHSQEPLFPDVARQRLAQSGIRVRTAADLEREERLLFELARTTATSRLTLSYAEADARGVRNLPSQFLSVPVKPCEGAIRPAPSRAPVAAGGQTFTIPPRTLSPSALECFLNCPFQFFARYTLKLRRRPLLPQDRLDFMLQGTIIHHTLSEWHRAPQPMEPLFDRVFAENCAGKNVFMGYRTEYLRRQMLDDLRQFSENTKLPPSPDILTEFPFEITLDDTLQIRGRIDRIDKLPADRALIVDYKYSAAARVKEKLTNTSLLQGGLYALAVERKLGLKPAGVFYFGLKQDSRIAGWSDPPNAFGVDSQPLTRQWIEAAADRARDAAVQIRGGRIAAEPASADLCGFCDYLDVCRYRRAAKTLTAET